MVFRESHIAISFLAPVTRTRERTVTPVVASSFESRSVNDESNAVTSAASAIGAAGKKTAIMRTIPNNPSYQVFPSFVCRVTVSVSRILWVV